jgi:ATP-binding cassette, subfamily B, bacterial MsbA
MAASAGRVSARGRGPTAAAGTSPLELDPEGFDRREASFPVQIVPVGEVIDLLNQTHRPDKVAEFRAAMDAGVLFPPLAVVRFGRRYILTDGHKRLTACKQRQMSHVMVEVWTLRRWLADLRAQSRHKARQVARLGTRSAIDPASRKASRRLFWDTVGHWQRIFRSIGVLLHGEPPPVEEAAAKSPAAAPAKDGVLGRLLRECGAFPGHLTLVATMLVLMGGAQLYLTWLVKDWVQGPLGADTRSAMAGLLTRGAITATLLVVGLFGSRYFARSLNQLLVERLRDHGQRRLLEVELVTARRFQAGELMSRLFNDAGILSEFVREILRRVIGESVVAVGALVLAFRLNWQLAMVIGLVGPAVAVMLSKWAPQIRRRNEEAQRELGKLNAVLTEQLAGLSTIKGFQTERHERERFARQDSYYRHRMLRAEVSMASMMSAVWAVTFAGLLGLGWFGTRQVQSGTVTGAQFFAFFLYAAQAIEPLRRLSEVQGLLQRSLAAAARVFAIIDLPLTEQPTGRAVPRPVRGALTLRDVVFSYDEAHPVLRGVNLEIGARETVALVAASGGGKSTLASLLLRFHERQRGSILLDGMNLDEIALTDLRRIVCVAEQESFVFSGTLLEAITYGSFDAPPGRIEFAIKLAGLEAFVRAHPDGVDRVLAEGGRNLSGGQKQRIALARTVVRDPAVLVLDEVTSALDGETERGVFAQMEPWLAERTVIVMSHRLATIMRFPRIIVLQNGVVVGDGTVQQLLELCPAFRAMFADQSEASAAESSSDGDAVATLPFGR